MIVAGHSIFSQFFPCEWGPNWNTLCNGYYWVTGQWTSEGILEETCI